MSNITLNKIALVFMLLAILVAAGGASVPLSGVTAGAMFVIAAIVYLLS